MGEFTKGPWRISHYSPTAIVADGLVDTVYCTVQGTIVRCEDTAQNDFDGRIWSTSGTAEANAHLISAAPDMYEALAGCMAVIEGYCELPETWPSYKAAKAALSKANGESDG